MLAWKLSIKTNSYSHTHTLIYRKQNIVHVKYGILVENKTKRNVWLMVSRFVALHKFHFNNISALRINGYLCNFISKKKKKHTHSPSDLHVLVHVWYVFDWKNESKLVFSMWKYFSFVIIVGYVSTFWIRFKIVFVLLSIQTK